MSEKTKYQAAFPWLIALCIAIIAIMIMSYFSVKWMMIDPVTHGRGITKLRAISEFGEGNPTTDPMWARRLAALSGIILIFVIGPVLWMFDSKSSGIHKSGTWYAGASLLMVGFIIAVLGTSRTLINTGHNEAQIKRNQNADNVRSEMATLSARAMELYWLPQERGGADHDVRSISMIDLKESESFENTFLLEKSPADSTLTIYGIGQYRGTLPEFKNANGEMGKVQLVAKVDPQQLETEWLRADSLRN